MVLEVWWFRWSAALLAEPPYHPPRTAVRKEVTSFGTFLSTLCHEFCHHLDFKKFGFVNSWHTRGFYERAGVLYHYARGTPLKRLFWVPLTGGRWRIERTKDVPRSPLNRHPKQTQRVCMFLNAGRNASTGINSYQIGRRRNSGQSIAATQNQVRARCAFSV